MAHHTTFHETLNCIIHTYYTYMHAHAHTGVCMLVQAVQLWKKCHAPQACYGTYNRAVKVPESLENYSPTMQAVAVSKASLFSLDEFSRPPTFVAH